MINSKELKSLEKKVCTLSNKSGSYVFYLKQGAYQLYSSYYYTNLHFEPLFIVRIPNNKKPSVYSKNSLSVNNTANSIRISTQEEIGIFNELIKTNNKNVVAVYGKNGEVKDVLKLIFHEGDIISISNYHAKFGTFSIDKMDFETQKYILTKVVKVHTSYQQIQERGVHSMSFDMKEMTLGGKTIQLTYNPYKMTSYKANQVSKVWDLYNSKDKRFTEKFDKILNKLSAMSQVKELSEAYKKSN